jgi:hypothetical protein
MLLRDGEVFVFFATRESFFFSRSERYVASAAIANDLDRD